MLFEDDKLLSASVHVSALLAELTSLQQGVQSRSCIFKDFRYSTRQRYYALQLRDDGVIANPRFPWCKMLVCALERICWFGKMPLRDILTLPPLSQGTKVSR